MRTTRANVERALTAQAAAGLIRRWRRHPNPPAGAGLHLLIDPVDGETIHLRTLAEAAAACAMLASAAHAILRMPVPPEPGSCPHCGHEARYCDARPAPIGEHDE